MGESKILKPISIIMTSSNNMKTHMDLPKVSLLIVAIALSVLFPSGSHAILSPDDSALVQDSIHYIENDEDAAICAGAGNPGSSVGSLGTTNDTTKAAADAREQAIWTYLNAHTAYGVKLQPFQVAGIMGNMQVESANTWNPTVVEGVTYADSPPNFAAGSPDNPPGYGIVQWTPGSKMLAPVLALGGKPNDLGSQLDLLWDQLFNTASKLNENAAGTALKAATDVSSATESFRIKFERNAAGFQQGRVDGANAIMAKYGGGATRGATGGSAAGGCAPPGGGTAISTEGWAFPMQTTKTVIMAGSKGNGSAAGVWCTTSQINCHHDYNAADIFAPTGTIEVSVTDGTVVFANPNSLAIKSNNPKSPGQYVFWYGHILAGSIKVKGGDVVKAGQPISQVGTIADADGTPPHLHIDAEPAPPATTRPACSNAACATASFNFVNIQPLLVAAYQGVPN